MSDLILPFYIEMSIKKRPAALAAGRLSSYYRIRVTVQDVQPNRPQTRALHALSLHSQLLSEANGRSAHSKMKIHPIANEFA